MHLLSPTVYKRACNIISVNTRYYSCGIAALQENSGWQATELHSNNKMLSLLITACMRVESTAVKVHKQMVLHYLWTDKAKQHTRLIVTFFLLLWYIMINLISIVVLVKSYKWLVWLMIMKLTFSPKKKINDTLI